MIAAIGAKWALAGGFKGIVRKVPRWLWFALLFAAIIAAGAWWHGRKVEAFGQERFAAGYAKAVDDGKKRVAKVERKSAEITAKIRRKTDEDIGRINRHADDLRLRGPGRAVCPAHAAAAGGPEPGRGAAAAGMDRLPDTERVDIIAMPYDDTIRRSATADANRREVLAYREAWQKLTEEYAKWRAEADAAARR